MWYCCKPIQVWKKQQLFFALPMHAKRVGIFIKRQRYKCRECNETFFESLPNMDISRSVTNRLIYWAQEESLEKTFISVADVENKSVIDILRKRSKSVVIDYLSKLQDIDKVELVAMDMWRPYRDAVNNAKIIIDKFHVIKLANEALEKIRKANRKNVSAEERRQLLRDRYVLLKRHKDLIDFDVPN